MTISVDNAFSRRLVRLARTVDQGEQKGQTHQARVGRVVVPGYRLSGVLGTGAGGPVWSAVRDSDGLTVAIKIVDPGRPGELAVLRGLHHPHVIGLVADVLLPDGRLALVLERVDGGSLARVVRERGHLTPGETVTVITTLGTTLADLHRLGVTHADLSPGNVLFHPDGRPMVADLGVARIAGLGDETADGTPGFTDPRVFDGEPAGPAADVFALAALGWFCLVGAPPPHPAGRPPLAEVCPSAPAALTQAIDAALDSDPSRRIDAGELAWRVYGAGTPVPVTLAGGADPATELTRRIRAQATVEPEDHALTRRPRLTRPRLTRPLRIGITVTPVLTALLVVGLLVARSAANAAPSWSAVVSDLSAARAVAFAEPARGPGGLDLPGSPAWHQDQAALDRLRTAGLSYQHLTITITDLRVLSESGRSATLELAVSTSAYDVVGGATQREPPTAPRSILLTLRRVADGWRVFAVRPR